MKKMVDSRLKRIRKGPMASDDTYGMNGVFLVTGPKGKLQIIVSDQEGWEHVSVTTHRKARIPTWEEMAFVKDLFWKDDECVVQYHPPKSQYVNNYPYVLHLWRLINQEIPLPPVYMVGIPDIRVTQTMRTETGMIVAGVDDV